MESDFDIHNPRFKYVAPGNRYDRPGYGETLARLGMGNPLARAAVFGLLGTGIAFYMGVGVREDGYLKGVGFPDEHEDYTLVHPYTVGAGASLFAFLFL